MKAQSKQDRAPVCHSQAKIIALLILVEWGLENGFVEGGDGLRVPPSLQECSLKILNKSMATHHQVMLVSGLSESLAVTFTFSRSQFRVVSQELLGHEHSSNICDMFVINFKTELLSIACSKNILSTWKNGVFQIISIFPPGLFCSLYLVTRASSPKSVLSMG